MSLRVAASATKMISTTSTLSMDPQVDEIVAQWQKKHSSTEAQQALAPRLEAAPISIHGKRDFLRCFANDDTNAPRFTMFLVGDSTSRNVYRALCSTLDPVEWKVINDTSIDRAHLTCSGRLTRRQVLFVFVPAAMWRQGAVDDAYGLIGARPDVVVVTGGLWTMWPTPFSGKYGWPWHDLWLHFTRSFNATLSSYRQSRLAPRRVLVTTIHAVCEYEPPSRERLEGCIDYLSQPNGTVFNDGTIKRVKPLTNDHSLLAGIDKAAAEAHCVAGARTYFNARALNEQLHSVVAHYAGRHLPPVGLVDTFTLTDNMCWANDAATLGNDVMHFELLLYQEAYAQPPRQHIPFLLITF